LSDETMNRSQVLEVLCKILERQAEITEILEQRLCDTCDLPRDELGISAQAASSYLLRIQCTLAHVLLMIDMVRGASFSEIYMESFRSIIQKVYEEFIAVKHMTGQCGDNPEEMSSALQSVLRLEREIDEDNIIICRQVTVATGGESDFICYMMRKIVRELEHISDYLKACAEIIAEI